MLSRTRLTGLIALTALLTAGGNSRADDDAASLLAEFVGEIVAGGEWQTANPDYRTDTEQPSHFSLRYRWGPGRSQVVSELVGVFKERPETPVYWTIYTYVDPETRSVEVLQIGAGGGLAKGTMTMNAQGQRIIDQTFVAPGGSSRQVRHIETFHASGDRFDSSVLERDGAGEWQIVREWVWTRVEGD